MSYLDIVRRTKEQLVQRPEAALSKEATAETEIVDDPVLSPEQWYPEFHRFHMAVIAETPDFDYGWLRRNRLVLYRQIKAKENEIDALGSARLSNVMALMREWRELILMAEFERRRSTR